MKVVVEFTRYFEEFGFEDFDTKEFATLNEANDFFWNNEKATKLIVDGNILNTK